MAAGGMAPGTSWALLTDLYELTMACGYWRCGLAEREAVFCLSFRENPFGHPFSLACGLAHAVDMLEDFRFGPDEQEYLRSLVGADGRPLLDAAFLDYLGRLRLTVDLDAVPEGTVVFPHEPLVRVRGPLLAGPTAGIDLAERGELPDAGGHQGGADLPCRGSWERGRVRLATGTGRERGVGGQSSGVCGWLCRDVQCAGRPPVRHSGAWYARPQLGHVVRNRIGRLRCLCRGAAQQLHVSRGHLRYPAGTAACDRRCAAVTGSRAPSGGRASRLRRSGGAEPTCAANAGHRRPAGCRDRRKQRPGRIPDHRAARQGARIDVWGVGTRLATAYDQPALGGVYKLAALRDEQGQWDYKLKLSEQPVKTSTPGVQQIRRFSQRDRWVGDMIFDELTGVEAPAEVILADGRRVRVPPGSLANDLLCPVLRAGQRAYSFPTIHESRQRALEQSAELRRHVERAAGDGQLSGGDRERAASAQTADDPGTGGITIMKLIHVAAAVLNQTPLAWESNQANILGAMGTAREQGVRMLCLPELCITGYGCEDAFHSPGVHQTALQMLREIVPATRDMIVSVGLPVMHRGSLFNAACLIVDQRIAGFVAKQNLAGEGIHYEPRWFKPWPGDTRVEFELDGTAYPLGDLIFSCGDVLVGFEICEDAWVAERPGSDLARLGVDVIFNPSASHFAFGKHAVRQRFVLEGSRAFQVSYIYANLLGNEAGRRDLRRRCDDCQCRSLVGQRAAILVRRLSADDRRDRCRSHPHAAGAHRELPAADSRWWLPLRGGRL